MLKKVLGILVCMLLITIVLPTSSALESEPEEIKFRTIMFARGRIDGYTEDVVNDIECYRCPIVDVWEIFLTTITIVPIGIQRNHCVEPHPYDLLIPKDMFHGILTENYVIGLIQWWY